MAKVTDAQIKKAIAATGGNVWEMSKILPIVRKTIYAHIDASPDLQDALREAREEIQDIAESHHIRKVKEGEDHAIDRQFRLSPEARRRGWSSRTEISGPDGGPIVVKGYKSVSPDDWDNDESDIAT